MQDGRAPSVLCARGAEANGQEPGYRKGKVNGERRNQSRKIEIFGMIDNTATSASVW